MRQLDHAPHSLSLHVVCSLSIVWLEFLSMVAGFQEGESKHCKAFLRCKAWVGQLCLCNILLAKRGNQPKLKGGIRVLLLREEWQSHFTKSMGGNVTATFANNFHSSWRNRSMGRLNNLPTVYSPVQFSSVAQLCLTLCDPMNHSTPGLPVHHQLLEFTQTHVHRVSDAIQPSHPLPSPSPPAPNPSQHQGLFQWVNSSHEVANVLEFQLQHQSFQWTPRTDLL